MALAAGRFMTELLFQTSHRDVLTFAAVVLVLLTAAVVASLLPARRATGVSPTIALRSD